MNNKDIKDDTQQADNTTRLLALASRMDWIFAVVFLALAAYQASATWGVVGGVFLLTAWINPVARMRKAMARSLVKRG